MLLDTLQSYLALGWYLMPLNDRKAPLTANGFKDASNDVAQVQEWIKTFPGCLWGVATGPSQLLVVDVDLYKGATSQPLELATGVELSKETVAARTISDGQHYYYKRPVECTFGQGNGLWFGIDVRACLGYVVIPPSTVPPASYTWINDPKDTVLQDAPQELVAYLNQYQPAKERKELEHPTAEDVFLAAGTGRYDFLRSCGGYLRARGWGHKAITEALLAFYKAQCEPSPGYEKKIRDIARFLETREFEALVETGVTVETNNGTRKLIEISKLPFYLGQGARIVPSGDKKKL
jgi:hypothetical protein